MVGLGGLEPPTSRLSSARSNQLSYKPDLPLTRRIAPLRGAGAPRGRGISRDGRSALRSYASSQRVRSGSFGKRDCASPVVRRPRGAPPLSLNEGRTARERKQTSDIIR